MKIKKFDTYKVALPFRVHFKHAQAERSHSASIFVRCELEDGTFGFGESLPREYVTGESWDGCFDNLTQWALPLLLKECDFCCYAAVETYCEALYGHLLNRAPAGNFRIGALCCAAELALLDAYGRHFARTAFAAPAEKSPAYSGVVSSSGLLAVLATSWLCRRAKLKAVKLKAGTSHDKSAAYLARLILGSGVSIRVDANMAWTIEQALKIIPHLRRRGIIHVEQPLARGRYADSRRIQEKTGVAVIADEDLCDGQDARDLIQGKACRVFNLRASKCGGFFSSLRLGQLARKHGLQVQIGCQVGETALLSAVGLALARRLAPVVFAEGCFGRRLLVDDPLQTEQPEAAVPFEFGPGGCAPAYRPERGTGILLSEERLFRHAREHVCLKRSAKQSRIPDEGGCQ